MVGSPWSPAIGRVGKRLPSLCRAAARFFLVWLLPVGAGSITVCLLIRSAASPVLPAIALQVFAVVACFGCSRFHRLGSVCDGSAREGFRPPCVTILLNFVLNILA